MNRILQDYRYYLRMERSLSPNTVAAYGRDVEDFLAAVELEPRSVRPDDVERYLAARTAGDRGLSKRSQARLLSSLRSFFDWLVLEGERPDNPCELIAAPKLGRYLPAVLSVEEVTAILESVDTRQGSWTAFRDRAILEILYGCGLRVSEACGLLRSVRCWRNLPTGRSRCSSVRTPSFSRMWNSTIWGLSSLTNSIGSASVSARDLPIRAKMSLSSL